MDWIGLLISIGTGGYGIVSKWGYPGLFFVSLISSATIIFPIPSFFLIFTFGAVLNPFFVALISALGAAIGEITSYLIGLGGKKLLEKKYSKQIKKIRKTFEKYGSDLWIFILAATPFPDDIVGIFCGVIKYDLRRYFLALFLGKLVLSLILAFAGYYSVNWVLDYLQPKLGL